MFLAGKISSSYSRLYIKACTVPFYSISQYICIVLYLILRFFCKFHVHAVVITCVHVISMLFLVVILYSLFVGVGVGSISCRNLLLNVVYPLLIYVSILQIKLLIFERSCFVPVALTCMRILNFFLCTWNHLHVLGFFSPVY